MKVKNYHKFPYDASTVRLIRRFMILLNLKVLFLCYYKKKKLMCQCIQFRNIFLTYSVVLLAWLSIVYD